MSLALSVSRVTRATIIAPSNSETAERAALRGSSWPISRSKRSMRAGKRSSPSAKRSLAREGNRGASLASDVDGQDFSTQFRFSRDAYWLTPAIKESRGVVRTAFLKDIWSDDERGKVLLAKIPAGRIATVDDIVGAAILLASPGGSYISGQTLLIDGGRSVW